MKDYSGKKKNTGYDEADEQAMFTSDLFELIDFARTVGYYNTIANSKDIETGEYDIERIHIYEKSRDRLDVMIMEFVKKYNTNVPY
jgi:hypothetical protein